MPNFKSLGPFIYMMYLAISILIPLQIYQTKAYIKEGDFLLMQTLNNRR